MGSLLEHLPGTDDGDGIGGAHDGERMEMCIRDRYCPLRDEGEVFAQRLADDGGCVACYRVLDAVPVSYTHLDVYKRQAEQDVEFLFHYVASGLVGIIRLWLFDEPELSIDEVVEKAHYLMRLTTPKSA